MNESYVSANYINLLRKKEQNFSQPRSELQVSNVSLAPHTLLQFLFNIIILLQCRADVSLTKMKISLLIRGVTTEAFKRSCHRGYKELFHI